MEYELAILLRRKATHVVMLGRNRGVMIFRHCPGLSLVGSVVRLNLRTQGRVSIEKCELLDAPFALARDDLLFLHHILELCQACIPEGMRAPEIFDAIVALYAQWSESRGNQLCKKLFLCRLLVNLGLHDRLPRVDTDLLELVLAMPVDIARWSTIDLGSQCELDKWLFACVASHPMIERFKTVHFLTGRR